MTSLVTIATGKVGTNVVKNLVAAGERPRIYVRSEESEWGLIEIAWYLTLDLRIHGFKFQRCRNRYRTVLQQEFAGLESVGQIDFARRLNDARAGESDQGVWFCDDYVTE